MRRRGAIGCRRGDSDGDAEISVLRLLTTPLSLPVTKKGPIAKPSNFTPKKVCFASPGVRRLPKNSVTSLMAMNLGVSVAANSGWIEHPFRVTGAFPRSRASTPPGLTYGIRRSPGTWLVSFLGMVSDEGFWETRRLERLTKEIGEQSLHYFPPAAAVELRFLAARKPAGDFHRRPPAMPN